MKIDVGGWAGPTTPEGRIGAEALVEVFRRMGLHALNVTARELEHLDVGLLSGKDLPLISANIVFEDTGEPVFRPYVIAEIGGLRVGIVGVTDTSFKKWPAAGERTLVIADPIAKADEAIDRLIDECDVVVLAAHVPKWKLRERGADLRRVDLILAGDGFSVDQEPTAVGENTALYIGVQGQSVGAAELTRDSGEGWRLSGNQVIRLSRELAEDEEIKGIVGDTKRRMEQVYLQVKQ